MTDATSMVASLGLAPADVLGDLPDTGPRAGADSGSPTTRSRTLYERGPIACGVWECTPGGWSIEDRPNTEIIQVVRGLATLTDADGTRHDLVAGSVHVLPKGWSGRWLITETLRKVWVTIEGI
jgi:uncharacterized protein